MKNAAPRWVRAVVLLGLAWFLAGSQASGQDRLRERFRDPPAAARPAVYWVWLNGHVHLPQLTRELEEFKAKGIGKAYILECGARDPKRIVPAGPAFMGPESIQAIAHAAREAKRLGIELGLTTSSSWNAGGSWVTPKHASMGLFHSALSVTGPARLDQPLPFPKVPEKAPRGTDGKLAFSREVAVLAVPDRAALVDRRSVIDLTRFLDTEGRLAWEVPNGKWTILRFVCANTGQGLAIPSPNSQGLAIDHFSADATRMHFQFFFDRLQAELGPLKNTALDTLYLCSYELRGAVWTPNFLREFQARHGYDMTPFLPALAGIVIEKPEITERFLYDYRQTQGDLLVDAFYRTAAEMCHRQGLRLCAEAGGPGPPTHNVPVDALKAQGTLDIPRGEFWTGEGQHWVVKETACAAHIYGKPIVDMEAFTGWTHWQTGPFELKPLADRAFCHGANHLTFHTCPHTPPDAGRPGWVYHAGTHMGPSLVWWPMARPFLDYLARCSYLLQQGQFAGDVCYYQGDQGFNFVPPKRIDPSLGFGYDYDVTNAEALLTRFEVRDGRLVLPDGTRYELLVLPDRDDMSLEVLRKLDQLVRAGAIVVGRRPTRSTGLNGYPDRDREVSGLAEKIWGPCDGTTVKEHAHGKGKVIHGRTLREVLHERGVGPDFGFGGQDELTRLDFIHRRTADGDIWFVSNKNQRPEQVDCIFRIQGKQPELWLPETGEVKEALVWQPVPGGTRVPLQLPPAGSVFVVFRRPASPESIVSVRSGGLAARSVELGGSLEGKDAHLLAWQDGRCDLETSRGRKWAIDVPKLPAAREVRGPWEVRFAESWGAPAKAVFRDLISWSQHGDPGIKYYSGIATYQREFEFTEDEPGLVVALDLGQLWSVADVSLNGQPVGIVWKPPYRLDLTSVVKPGKNQLVVRVANTWSNRLVGDARNPDSPPFCRTNMANSQTWRVPWKDTPLLESGLIGPVRLQFGRKVQVSTQARRE